MPKFVSKRHEVEAIQFTPETWRECEAFAPGMVKAIGNWKHENDVICCFVGKEVHGKNRPTVMPGGWIVRRSETVRPMTPAEFADAYEPA